MIFVRGGEVKNFSWMDYIEMVNQLTRLNWRIFAVNAGGLREHCIERATQTPGADNSSYN